MQQIFSNLKQGIAYARQCLIQYGQSTKSPSWQGIKQEREMWEVDNVYFRACMPQSILALQEQVKPDLPWAEDHFKERVGGIPMNPGNQYKNWPGYKDTKFNDDNFRPGGEFSHTYMERYWPKLAGVHPMDTYRHLAMLGTLYGSSSEEDYNRGIRFAYGDLDDIINILINNPFTRQAYLPIFYPEDITAAYQGNRVPCTIGYHFMRKGDDLNIHYMIRACDYLRHFRNDIYMTVRLAQWVLEKLHNQDEWKGTQLGVFTMDIVHFHVFAKEKNLI